jgi:uncharacterized protein YydD (DUF2326 family)
MNRLNLFTEIHEIVFHSQGGYDWETVYNMPIWLRRFTFNKLKEYYEKKNESSSQVKDIEKVMKPNIQPKPTYNTTTKATTK